MKALTIRQPWASLIALGVKTIETRSWRAPQSLIGQTIAIHAGKLVALLPPEARPMMVTPKFTGQQKGLDRCLAIDGFFGEWTPLPLSAIVATATLADCLPMVDYAEESHRPNPWNGKHRLWPNVRPGELWRTNPAGGPALDVSDQLPYGDFQPGRWAWMLTDVQPCDPVPAKGKQGLWNWDGA